MPVEQLLEQYGKNKRMIAEIQREQDRIVDEIVSANTEQYDWVSVKTAAEKRGVSVQSIYRAINSGKIKNVRHFGSNKSVRLSEVLAIDDKYGAEE